MEIEDSETDSVYSENNGEDNSENSVYSSDKDKDNNLRILTVPMMKARRNMKINKE